MANLERVIQARMDRAVPSRVGPQSNLQRLLEARQMADGSPDGPGFLATADRFLGNTFGEPQLPEGSTVGDQFQADTSQMRAMLEGAADPVLGGVQAVMQIPGLFTSRDLPTDQAANYIERMRAGLLRRSEATAIQAGIDPEAIADIHLFGEMVGYTAPIVASLKAARLITGIQGPVISLGRNFHLDTAAGLIFGSTMVPEEELAERLTNTLRESAVFGVGGLMLNGLLFGATGMRFGRARALQAEADLETKLRRMANGERVVLEDGDLSLQELLSEEGFLASSPAAYSLLQEGAFDTALIQSIRDVSEGGLSRGYARSVGVDFASTSRAVERFRTEFPSLKFDIIKRGDRYDVHFGLTGLNNHQRAQLAREGRYSGQLIQKGDSYYLYNRVGKEGRLVVQTVDGKTTTITPKGVTDVPAAVEDVALPTAGQALYEDFRTFVFGKIQEAAKQGGTLSEVDLIRFIRAGQLDIEGTRAFNASGAITHPEELGLFPSGRRYEVTLEQVMGDAAEEGAVAFAIRDAAGQEAGHVVGVVQPNGVFVVDEMAAASNEAGAFGTGTMRDIGRSIVEQLEAQGVQIRSILGMRASGTRPGQVQAIDVADLMRTDGSSRGFANRYLQEGAQGQGLLEPEPIRRLDDAFNAWLQQRNLAPDAADIEAFRAHFYNRMQRDIWDLLPVEEAATLKRIRDETFKLLETNELPFPVLAGAKGFHVEAGEGTQVVLRDINTGMRMTYANQEVAERAIQQVVRAEKDDLFDFLTPGPHGVSAHTVGFDPTDGTFTFETNISPDEIFDYLPTQSFTNRRDYIIALEDASGLPVFTQGFAPIDEGLVRMRDRLHPFSQRIGRIWKGIDRGRRKAIAEFWRDIEGTDIAGTALVRAARSAGLSTREISALSEARKMFDLGAEMMGLPESRFISNYYSRIRPMQEAGASRSEILRALADDPLISAEFRFWAEMSRSGELSHVELDPELVMHRYFKSLMYKLEVAPAEERMRSILNVRIRDLPAEQQSHILRRSLPETTPDSFVLPAPIRAFTKEYLNNVRGDTSSAFASARRFTNRLFRSLGIHADPRVVDELHSTYLSMQYGAAIGLRAVLMNRNATQNMWTMYTRVGSKHGGESLRMALTQSGYDDAVLGNAIRETSATVPQHDAIFNAWFGADVARGSGPFSSAAAAVIRKSIRAGRVTRQVAQKFLVPYGSGDQINRAWAYHWQKLHTAEKLADFNAGRLDWDGFVEEGLPFFSSAIKRGFQERLNRLGTEDALRWIGKQAADEAHFIYGSASTPQWMQGFWGRLFGVFGQWPLWAKQLYKNRMAHATPKQIATFWGRTVALTGAFGNMAVQTGISMQSWIAPAALGFTGGPAVDLALTARDLWGGPLDQKAAALTRLGDQVGSLALPGQLFYNEMSTALDQNEPGQALLLLTLGRPSDKINFNYDIVLNPEEPEASPTERSFNLEGLQPVGALPGTR